MGEDIHQKTFAKSKTTGKWFDTANIDFDATQCMFKSLIPYRSYMLFSLFGSRRSDWKELDPSGYGIPDFIKADIPDFTAMHTRVGSGWYGYVWFTRKKLIEEIDKYIECLSSPEKYYADYDDEYKSEILQELDEIQAAKEDWKSDANSLKAMLVEIKEELESQEVFCKEDLDSLIDGSIDDVVYLFWFDC